jgi:hypothetical protein
MITQIGLLFTYKGISYFVDQKYFPKIKDSLKNKIIKLQNYAHYDKYRLTTLGFIFYEDNTFSYIPINVFIDYIINDFKESISWISKIYEQIFGYGIFIDHDKKYFINMSSFLNSDLDSFLELKEKNTDSKDFLQKENGEFYYITNLNKYKIQLDKIPLSIHFAS